MKKVLAIIMALAMVLSLGVTAFAETTDTGSITVTNATIDKTYAVFKVFDASFSDGAVSYYIDEDDTFYADLFGVEGAGGFAYFNYNSETKSVTKKSNVNDSDLINYLTGLVSGKTAVATKKADGARVEFTGLEHGYYIITSDLGSAVTIDSNTPHVDVIDKNQSTLSDFSKNIKAEDGTLSKANSAGFGDSIDYVIRFGVTNYNGAYKVKYYQINDEFGGAIDVDFNTLKVMVGDQPLEKGYYLNLTGGEDAVTDVNIGNWPESEESDMDKAQWYLVHLNSNQFRVTIPWLKDHRVAAAGNGSYQLITDENKDSLYTSPNTIEITYSATLKDNAYIGGGDNKLMENKAYATAICQNESISTHPDGVLTETFGLGLLKDDISTGKNLAGAEFRLYSDEDCQEPVNVTTTNIKGVYKVGPDATDNLVVSQANGKLVVLGLEAGTYYLVEEKAPAGYNPLSAPFSIVLDGENSSAFSVFANSSGEVKDTQFGVDGYIEHTYDVSNTIVHNSKGVELPSTGGEGTMMLITFGTIIAVAFAILLITRKKMSVYED